MHIIPATYIIIKSTRSIISNTSITLFLIVSASIYCLCQNLPQVWDDLVHPGLRLHSARCALVVVDDTGSRASTSLFQLSNQPRLHIKLADGFLLKKLCFLYLQTSPPFSAPVLNSDFPHPSPFIQVYQSHCLEALILHPSCPLCSQPTPFPLHARVGDTEVPNLLMR